MHFRCISCELDKSFGWELAHMCCHIASFQRALNYTRRICALRRAADPAWLARRIHRNFVWLQRFVRVHFHRLVSCKTLDGMICVVSEGNVRETT